MHELPVAQSILEIALRHAEQANARAVTDIYLVIGQLSSFIDDAIQFNWDMISENTIAEGAKLHFKRVSAEMLCLKCDQRYRLTERQFICPECGSTQVQIVAGEEFFMESIAVDVDS